MSSFPADEPPRLLPGQNPPPGDVFLKRPSERRLPVLADANALMPDIVHHAQAEFSFLTLLAERELITLACPTHVRGEVARYLPDLARRYGVEEAALRTWKQVHEPSIHFVEVRSDDFANDPRVLAVKDNDPDDVPLVQLGLLLAPSMVLSRDPDLTDIGIGLGYWVDPARTLLELAQLEETMYGHAHGTWTLLYLTARGLGAGGKAAARSPVFAGLLVALAVMAITDWREGTLSTLSRIRSAGAALLERGVPLVADAFDRHEAAQRQIEATLLQSTAEPSLASIAARALAEVGEPCPAAQLLEEVRRRGHAASGRSLNAVLHEHPAFVSVRGRGWQLGRVG